MLFKKKQENKLGLMALVGETAKMAKNMMVLDKTEAALEKELEKESKNIPTTKFGKFRKQGEHVLHSKHILLMVVILNIVDCLLVLGELMLDIKYVTDLLTKEYARSEEFVGQMKIRYPVRLDYLYYDDINLLEKEILKATITWDDYSKEHGLPTNDSAISNVTTPSSALPHNDRRRRAASGGGGNGSITHDGHDHTGHSIEEDIAHGLHKASITILGILVVETLFKIVCLGKELLNHKLECFDGFVVFVSFVVDLVLLKGLQQFKVQEFVLILSFLVPWRVVRVVNSLVVAIMDHEHFRLKLLYKQKKKTTAELKDAQVEITGLKACIKELENLCTDAGVDETQIMAKLKMFRMVQGKNNPMGALSSFAVGGNAMKQPFPHNLPRHEAVITLETDRVCNGSSKVNSSSKALYGNMTADTLDIAGSISSLASSGKDGDTFNKAIKKVTDDVRPRSISAIEPRQTDEQDRTLLNHLAEQSAGFIATINDDNISRTPPMTKKGETNIGYLKTEDTSTDNLTKDEKSKMGSQHGHGEDKTSEL